MATNPWCHSFTNTHSVKQQRKREKERVNTSQRHIYPKHKHKHTTTKYTTQHTHFTPRLKANTWNKHSHKSIEISIKSKFKTKQHTKWIKRIHQNHTMAETATPRLTHSPPPPSTELRTSSPPDEAQPNLETLATPSSPPRHHTDRMLLFNYSLSLSIFPFFE